MALLPKISQEPTLHLMQDINSVVLEPGEKNSNIYISHQWQELKLKCLSQLFVLRNAQPLPPLLVQLALQFQDQ